MEKKFKWSFKIKEVLEGWLNLQSRESLDGAGEAGPWLKGAGTVWGRAHVHSHVVLCVLGFGGTPGLSSVLSPGDPGVPRAHDVQLYLVWKQQLWAAVSWLNRAWRGWNLAWMGAFHFPGRQSQEELRIGPHLVVKNISSAWLGFRAHRVSTSKYSVQEEQTSRNLHCAVVNFILYAGVLFGCALTQDLDSGMS